MFSALMFSQVVSPSESPLTVPTEERWRIVGRLMSFKIESSFEGPETRPATVAPSSQVG